MLLPSGKCHEEVLYFQLLIPPKRFDIFFPLTGGCSEGLGAFRFFFKEERENHQQQRRCLQQNPEVVGDTGIHLKVDEEQ